MERAIGPVRIIQECAAKIDAPEHQTPKERFGTRIAKFRAPRLQSDFFVNGIQAQATKFQETLFRVPDFLGGSVVTHKLQNPVRILPVSHTNRS